MSAGRGLDEETSRPFIKRALELGINFFDTANVYSNGRSEEIVGKALRDFATRDEVVLATKGWNLMSEAGRKVAHETLNTALDRGIT